MTRLLLHAWEHVRAELEVDESRVERECARRLRAILGYELVDRREAAGLSRKDVAKAMRARRSWVRAIALVERGEVDRCRLGVLRSYVEAIGGKLEVRATFDDGEDILLA